MSDTFHLIVASVGETRFEGHAHSAIIPTSSGEITVLAHHQPLVATLKPGTITVRATDGDKQFEITDGVLEVSGNRAVVLL